VWDISISKISSGAECFQQALTISPNYKEARNFSIRRGALQRQKEQIDRMLAEANRLAQKQQIYEVSDLSPSARNRSGE
jgi:hypothetical protein